MSWSDRVEMLANTWPQAPAKEFLIRSNDLFVNEGGKTHVTPLSLD